MKFVEAGSAVLGCSDGTTFAVAGGGRGRTDIFCSWGLAVGVDGGVVVCGVDLWTGGCGSIIFSRQQQRLSSYLNLGA